MPPELELRRNEILKERDLLKSKVFDLEISWEELFNPGGFRRRDSGARRRQGHDGVDSRTRRQQQDSGVSPDQSQCNSNLIRRNFEHHKFQFTIDMVDTLFKYAKFSYECGNYTAASVCLYYYRNLIPQHDSNYLNALYGKLASEILLQVDYSDFNFMLSHINTFRFTQMQFSH